MSHYNYLDANWTKFAEQVGVKDPSEGMIVAHGDKCYQYKDFWEANNVPFYHGTAIFLLSYCYPFTEEYGERSNVKKWVVESYDRFKEYLPNNFDDYISAWRK